MALCDWCADVEKALHLLNPHICLSSCCSLCTPTCICVHVKEEKKPVPPPKPKCVCSQYTFELSVDMQQYQPEEIHVSTINNVIVIEAKHEEKHGEHGHVTREFLRRCTLPPQNDITKVVCVLSSDGILKITAPKKGACKPGERIIPVEQTGLPACRA